MDLRTNLAEAREQRAHLEKLLTERATVADAARALLEQPSTFPKKRRDVEAELQRAEMDLQWIRTDLAALVSRERMLEADLACLMTEDLELRAARAAKAAPSKSRAREAAPPEGGETSRAADASSQENPAPARP